MNAVLFLNQNYLQVDGRFTYTRQVGDVGDISTSNSNHTNSFSLIRDNNSTRAMQGLGLPGSRSRIPYTKFTGALMIDELLIVDTNGYIIVGSTDISNYKISIIDGNIDFWQAIKSLTLADIDLSQANFTKTRQGIIDSFTNPYQKFLIGEYYVGRETESYDINLLNPAISDKYILDQIFEYINMSYTLSPVIDSWTVIGQPKDQESIGYVDVIDLEIVSDSYILFDDVLGEWDVEQDTLVVDEGTFSIADRKITIENEGTYEFLADWGVATAEYYIRGLSGYIEIIRLPVHLYLEVNGERFDFTQGIYRSLFLTPYDEIYLRFKPIREEDLPLHGVYNSTIESLGPAAIIDFEFKLRRRFVVSFTFQNELGKITVTEFIKQIMHRYALTVFYDNKTRRAEFLTMDERINAPTQNLNKWFVDQIEEKYIYQSYSQLNYLKHKYAQEFEDFNDGVILIDNYNLDNKRTIIESFTYSQDIDGIMEMWEYKGEGKYDQISGRWFSVRAKMLTSRVEFRDGDDPLSGYSGLISFVDFDKTGFRYFKNKYYNQFESRVLSDSKIQKVKLDMPLSIFMNLDLRKTFYIQQSNFLISKITYKGLRDVEAEIVKIK